MFLWGVQDLQLYKVGFFDKLIFNLDILTICHTNVTNIYILFHELSGIYKHAPYLVKKIVILPLESSYIAFISYILYSAQNPYLVY